MKRTHCLAVCVLAFASACRTYVGDYHIGAADYVLATRKADDGRQETFHVQPRGGGSLRMTAEFDRRRPFLGFKVVELERDQAEKRGVRPFSGLLVTGVYPDSGAAEAGVLAGDVLLSLDGADLVYLPQLTKAEAKLSDGRSVAMKVLRGTDTLDVSVSARMLTERITEVQEIALDAPPVGSPRPYAGAVLRGIPGVWCERIFGVARQAVVVASVEVGSPAWLAGIRGGDVIDDVDGKPVPDVQELGRLVAERGAAGDTMVWTVRRGASERHEGTLHLDDFSGETRLSVPLLACYENGTYEDSWSLLMGMLMRNRNRYVADASSRRVQTENVFSAVLGLFRVDSSPGRTQVRLLWFIRFET
jgi:membrane-associated protease RseP (regulator of RpoE activity)